MNAWVSAAWLICRFVCFAHSDGLDNEHRRPSSVPLTNDVSLTLSNRGGQIQSRPCPFQAPTAKPVALSHSSRDSLSPEKPIEGARFSRPFAGTVDTGFLCFLTLQIATYPVALISGSMNLYTRPFPPSEDLACIPKPNLRYPRARDRRHGFQLRRLRLPGQRDDRPATHPKRTDALRRRWKWRSGRRGLARTQRSPGRSADEGAAESAGPDRGLPASRPETGCCISGSVRTDAPAPRPFEKAMSIPGPCIHAGASLFVPAFTSNANPTAKATPRRSRGLFRAIHSCCFGVPKPIQIRSGSSLLISSTISPSSSIPK